MNTQFITDHKSHRRSLHAFHNFHLKKNADSVMQTTDFSNCWKFQKKKMGQQITCVNLDWLFFRNGCWSKL